MSGRTVHETTCAACGGPLGGDGMRVGGVMMHPGCLPSGSKD
jgi:hypothetical protein